jgi:tRNA pseudouridine55 synthase
LNSPVAADGLLLLDKPSGITSTRALAMSRRALAAEKAGHTGTLDPFATGLLPLVFGEATKFSRFLLDADKTYRATVCLGTTTSTGDPEGEVLSRSPVSCTIGEIEDISRQFIGDTIQVPPMHSALRVGGERLYDLARRGMEVSREARPIRIDMLLIEEFVAEKLVISVKCSKGTYVRTLAEDLGARLGCGGYLTDLRRTAIGRFRVEEALTPEALSELGPEEARKRLLPTEVLVESLPRLELDDKCAWGIRNGQELAADPAWGPGEHGLFSVGGGFIGVGCVAAGRLTAVRLMATGMATGNAE